MKRTHKIFYFTMLSTTIAGIISLPIPLGMLMFHKLTNPGLIVIPLIMLTIGGTMGLIIGMSIFKSSPPTPNST